MSLHFWLIIHNCPTPNVFGGGTASHEGVLTAPDNGEFPDPSVVPESYLNLKEVFNKATATSLPIHDHMTAPSAFCLVRCHLGTSILPLNSGTTNHGGIHQCGSKGRDYSALFFTCWSWIFLRGKKGQVPSSVHRLSWT